MTTTENTMSSYYKIPEREYADLLCALESAGHALNLALNAYDMGNESGAVVQMVRDSMRQWADRFDRLNLDVTQS